MTRALVLAILVACGGSSAKSAAEPSARAISKCEAAADALILAMPAKKDATEAVDEMRRVFAQRCEEDTWTAEAQECFAKITSMQDAQDRCASLLTQPQLEAFGAAIMAQLPKEQAPAAPPPAPVETPTPAPEAQAAPPPPARAAAPAKASPPAPMPAPKPKRGRDTSDPCEGGE